MSFHVVDQIFPFVVFFYGALMCFVLELPALANLGQQRLPSQLREQMLRHRPLAYTCLFVGGLWSLQNLWL